MITASADFAALVRAIEATAATIAAARRTAPGPSAPDDPRRWRDPALLWPEIAAPFAAPTRD